MTGAFLLGGAALVVFGLDRMGAAVLRPTPRPPRASSSAPGVRAEQSAIPSAGRLLNAWVLTSADPVQDPSGRPVVLLTHGWGSSHEGVLGLGRGLARCGHDVVVFDVRGHGANPRESYVTVRHVRDDVQAATRFSRARFPGRPLALVGHSMGAAASVLAAADHREADAVALVACPADVLEVTATYLTEQGLPGGLMVRVLLPFWWPRAGGSFGPLTPERRIGEIDVPMLVVHPELDTRVDRGHADRLAAAAGRPVTVVEGAGHSDVLARPELVEVLGRFLGRL